MTIYKCYFINRVASIYVEFYTPLHQLNTNFESRLDKKRITNNLTMWHVALEL